MRAQERLFLIVRHGERLDEVDRSAWKKIRDETNRHDPPLTEQGRRQAHAAGLELSAYLQHVQQTLDGSGGTSTGSPAVRVYASPTDRTMATAEELCRAITSDGGLPLSITPHYGLNCCAAAKTYGVQSYGFRSNLKLHQSVRKLDASGVQSVFGNTKTDLRSSDTCRTPPILGSQEDDGQSPPPTGLHVRGDPAVMDARNQGTDGGFVRTCVELAAEAASSESGGSVAILVTHREGIWDIQAAAGLKPSRTAYCSVTPFVADLDTGRVRPGNSVVEERGLQMPAPFREAPNVLSHNKRSPVQDPVQESSSEKTPASAATVQADARAIGASAKAAASVSGDAPGDSGALEAMLARGSGRVMFCPSIGDAIGATEEAPAAKRRLLLTPGAMTSWVPGDNGLLQRGQEVELCSGPVESEPGVNGEPGLTFVKVKTLNVSAAGCLSTAVAEGWVLLQNIHLPSIR